MKNVSIHEPRIYSMDELRSMGKRLRLSSMVEHLADLSSDPHSSNWCINQWLGTLFESEVERKSEAKRS